MRRPHDTSAAAWASQLQAFRAMPARDRLRLALEMSEEVRQISRAGERHRGDDPTLARTHRRRETEHPA